MANYKTGAQRYNDRMEKIFAEAKEYGLVGDSKMKGHGVHSPAMTDARNKAIQAKKHKDKIPKGIERKHHDEYGPMHA